jgi:hypothetical protein
LEALKTRYTIAEAAFAIGTPSQPIAPQVVQRAAKRFPGAIQRDDRGRQTVTDQLVELFQRNYRQFGVLHRRGQRSLDGAAG